VKILHLSDIHLGSGFAHGRLDPETGMNSRLLDFVAALAHIIDRAIAEPVDLVMFGGDAFPDATPPPYIQEAFAAQFRRLVDRQIPLILLVGNHDQHAQGQGGASLAIYRTLGVPGVIVGDRLATHRLATTTGDLQVITLPWINRSALLTRPEAEKLSLPEVNQLLVSRLEPALEGEVRRLDPQIPTILLAHVMADNAKLGAEKMLAVGRGFNVPVSLMARDCFDYVALGHVHRHQNLNPGNDPPIVYPGSIERVDFSEEKEDKGYVLIHIAPAEPGSATPHLVHWEFCPLPVRPFRTLKVDVTKAPDPQGAIVAALQKAELAGAVVRLVYRVTPSQTDALDTTQLHELLQPAHSYTMQAELISQLSQPRLPELGANPASPIEALATYLDHRSDLAAIRAPMMAAAQGLMVELGAEMTAEDKFG
jgi:DNA repair protein SbcD/Mre11